MDSSTLIESLKLPLIGGVLLSLSSMNLLYDFSKVLGCSQSLKSIQNSYKYVYLRYIKNRRDNNDQQQLQSHILFNDQMFI
ncbi:hypothetical protein KEM48_008125 [Puccinia striiformis f. sp. tritici PST-130]|nr:hypothetical protein KEM48_008125 [Puccinia striiformis f. sp. tritici PST-130]